jgi:hypothetical protein
MSLEPATRQLFLISGIVGVGKDTAANIITNIIGPEAIYCRSNSSPLKRIMAKLYTYFHPPTCPTLDVASIEILKDQKDHYIIDKDNTRDSLFTISDILKAEFGEEIWIELFYKKWLKTQYVYGVIPDIRRDELAYARKFCPTNVFITHIHLEGESRRDYKNIGHGMNEAKTDDQTIFIVNDGSIEDLYRKIRGIIHN